MAHSQHHEPLISLLSANSQWADDVERVEPGFFEQSALGQAPHVSYCAIAKAMTG